MDISLRPLETANDFRQCIELQRLTWGDEFTELVPASILKITQQVGGVAAGAFDPGDRLLGFVFGMSGMRDGRPAHWSDMLAVRPEARGHGVGRRLKAYQRDLLLEHGIEIAFWTYDPLVARNAHLNLNRLGARPIEYVRDMYGDTRSALHAGLGTDRFIVEWELAHRRVEAALGGTPPADLPSDADIVRVEIPPDIQRIKTDEPEEARAWRERTREAFLYHLGSGYRVTGFRHDPAAGRCEYVLERVEPMVGAP